MEYLGTIASHLQPSLDPNRRRATVENMAMTLNDQITNYGLTFDAIAVRGVSGLLLGTAIADKFNKNLIVVRTHQAGHSGNMVEGPKDGRYIIVDDLISTGKTVWIIAQTIKHHLCEYSECVGFLNHFGDFRNDNYLHDLLNNSGEKYGLRIDKRSKYVIINRTGQMIGRDTQTDHERQ